MSTNSRNEFEKNIEETIRRVNQASDVLSAVDDLNCFKFRNFMVNLISLFARRECMHINSIVRLFEYEYKQKKKQKMPGNSDFVNDTLSIYFLMRDIIENIEILYFMLLNEEDFLDSNFNYSDENQQRLKMLHGEEKIKGFRIYKDEDNKKPKLEDALYKKYKKYILEDDFERIKALKAQCNNIIHKNGVKNIYPVYQRYYDYMIDKFHDLLFICRFNFKMLFFA